MVVDTVGVGLGNVDQPQAVAYVGIQPYLVFYPLVQADARGKSHVDGVVVAVRTFTVNVVAVAVFSVKQKIDVWSNE